jgi:hypothetical protein
LPPRCWILSWLDTLRAGVYQNAPGRLLERRCAAKACRGTQQMVRWAGMGIVASKAVLIGFSFPGLLS